METTLLIAGGILDPNLGALAAACRLLNVKFVDVRHGPDCSPKLSWSIPRDELFIDGMLCLPSGCFIRHDVFAGLKDARPENASRAYAWFQSLHGWAIVHEQIRLFNRFPGVQSCNKPAMLIAALAAGLSVPETWITNVEHDLLLHQNGQAIAKPVGGGDHCYLLEEVIGRTAFREGAAACPAIVQRRLVSPEVRVYVIGTHAFSFHLASQSLDYRVQQDVEITFLHNPPSVIERLRRLMEIVSMDYGAADFKTDPDTGDLVFLELNTSPMFARCDLEADGAISQAIVQELTGKAPKKLAQTPRE